MSYFVEQMQAFGYKPDTIEALSKLTNDPSEAIEILESKKNIIQKLQEFGIDETQAEVLSLNYNNIEEAVNSIYQTIKVKRYGGRPHHSVPPQQNYNPIQALPAYNSYYVPNDYYNPNYSQNPYFPQMISIPPPPPPPPPIHHYDYPNYPHHQNNQPDRQINPYDSYNYRNLTASIYLAPPGVGIDGKQVINPSREEMIDYIMDEYGKKPLKNESIRKIQNKTLRKGELSEEECAICLQYFAENDEVMVLPCRHTFHSVCINKHFTYNNRCPTDNLEVNLS